MSQTTDETKKAFLSFGEIRKLCDEWLTGMYAPITVYSMLKGTRTMSPVVESAVLAYNECKEKHTSELESAAAAFRRTHLPESLNNA